MRYIPVCLNCTRKLVSPLKPRRREPKYNPLRRYLTRRPPSIKYSTLTLAEIEKIIEDKLPSSALQHRHWWSNTDSSVQARSWSYAGWEVQTVNLSDKTVVFRRIKTTETRTPTKRKRSRASMKKAFRPPSPRAPQRRIPSQTRTAIAIARLRNIERRKSSIRRYRGKFKPQSALEKRLYKPEAKPKKFNRA